MVATTPRARTRAAPGPPRDEHGRTSTGAARDPRPEHRLVVVLLIAVALGYVVVATLGDARGYSGSDAGGKAATAKIMAERATTDPDIGYWAAAVDPTGAYHPMVNTERRGDRWVQATSIPFSVAEARLWAWGGPGAALTLPMAGGVLAAYGAWLLARVLGGGARAAATALVLVGALGPVGFYATDHWEHAAAVGLALVGTAVVLGRPRPLGALLAGLALGTAVVLRAEVAVHLVVLGVATLAVAPVRRHILRPAVAAAGIGGALLALLANAAIESATVGQGVRSGRAGTLAAGAGHGLGTRVADALLVSGAPFADSGGAGIAAAALLVVVALAVAAIGLGRWPATPRVARVLVAIGLALYAGRVAQGLGFIPGMLAAAPVAAAGIVAGTTGRGDPLRRAVAVVAIAQIPMIWALQWSGNHVAQWGGRYLLVPGALLTVVGSVALFERTTARMFRTGMLALAGAVGVFGLAWHVQRSREVGRAFSQIDALPASTVVVSTDANALREGGAFFAFGARWLRVGSVDDLVVPGGLADRLAIHDLTLLTPVSTGTAPLPVDYRLVGERVLAMPGDDLVLRRYLR